MLSDHTTFYPWLHLTGATSKLKAELTAKKEMDPSYILQIFQGKSFSSTGEETVQVEVDGMHSKVSLISMLGPSPDWFVGVDSMDLCDNWSWRNMAVEESLPPWDSGTDSGKRFQSPDEATVPPAKIAVISNSEEGSFKSSDPIKSLGTLMFMRDGYEPTMSTTTTTTTTMMATTESGVSSLAAYAGLLLTVALSATLALL